MNKDFVCLLGKITEKKKRSVFGDWDNKIDDLEFKQFPRTIKYPQLLRELGIFSSTSEARRNGWEKEIPEGYTEFKIGKFKTRITIFKRSYSR